MEHDRFDQIARTLSRKPSRRTLAGIVGLGALGVAGGAPGRNASARKKRKKITLNEFGCVDVGKFCKNADQCCSGICQGKKGKKKCQAHGASTCVSGQAELGCGGTSNIACKTPNGGDGQCNTTTGNAGYCLSDGGCFACKKDVDCVARCGAGAACTRCATGCAATGGTACAGLEDNSCVAPEV